MLNRRNPAKSAEIPLSLNNPSVGVISGRVYVHPQITDEDESLRFLRSLRLTHRRGKAVPTEECVLHLVTAMIEQPSQPDFPRPPDPIDKPPPDIKPVPPPDIPVPGAPDIQPPTFPDRGNGPTPI